MTQGAQARGLTPADLVSLERVSDVQPSPDGRLVAYDVRSTDLTGDKGRHELTIARLGVAPAMPVARMAGVTAARWAPDGRDLYGLKGGQVWRIPACYPSCRAAGATQVTHLPLEVGSFRLSPDGRTLVVSMAVFPDAEDPGATRARLDARSVPSVGTGRLYDKLFVRHWDSWADGTRNHLFALRLDGGVVAGPPAPLTPGLDGDVPGKPFGDDADYGFSPDGRTLYFAARLGGRSEPWSTNFDVYSVPSDGSARPRNLTPDNAAWDADPVVSPDGRTLAYKAMARPGFEADRFVVQLLDLESGHRRALTPGWDRSAGRLAWSADGRRLYTTTDDDGYVRLFAIDVATGATTPLTRTGHVSDFRPLPGGGLVLVRDSMAAPAQVEWMASDAAPAVAVTRLDAERLARVQASPYQRFSFAGWNGETVHGWIMQPAGYQPGRKYPVAFLIHGGPQGSWADSWSYRWNPQVFAGRGYAVVMIDPHGSTGYGQAFTDAVSNHWGDRPLEDLQKGWAAALAAAPYLDASRACALGASYGGFMVNWIAGVWNGPWRCLVTHDGVFDDRMMGFATEELWFSEWEHGGPGHTPWDDPAAYERFNPALHVKDWIRPQLIIHSEKDFRIPIEQGLGAFDALQRRGIESRFLTFPDENHWVLKPANSLTWHATVLDWLDAHTK